MSSLYIVDACVCMLSPFTCVWLLATVWTCSLPGSSIHGILQARIMEQFAISSSRGSSWLTDRTHISYVSCIENMFFHSIVCFVYHWWEYKLVQPLWETVWEFLKRLQKRTAIRSSNLSSGYISKGNETIISKRYLDSHVNCSIIYKSQSCLTLCDPIGCSPPGFSVLGILQVRILEWVAISFLRGSESEQTPGDSGGQRNLACCAP